MAKIVQDRVVPAVVHCPHGAPHDDAGEMNELLGLVGFAFVGSITPGPNNSLLLASGTRFGFGRTVPHVAGTAVGMGALVLAVAGGVGVVLEAVPAAEVALKVAGSAYLLYLAFRIASSRGGGGGMVVSRPLGVLSGAAFQFANPKAWLFALAAVGAFLPPGLAPVAAGLAVAATSAVVILGTAAVWAAGGAGLRRLDDGRAQRAVNVALALVLAASVAFIWR
jgi:threonine/homoserine/homoserine lactone efflux protein